jgi:hypothetical protein
MGQRIIISESDRKHIKKLYESKIESPPPNESILVIENKNPFKYDEYTDARREYSKDLKDGDLFYVIKYPNFRKYVVEKFKPLYNNFIGKTIRIKSKDDIVMIQPNHREVSYMPRIILKDGSISFHYKIEGYDYSIYVLYNDNKFNGSIVRDEYENTIIKKKYPMEYVRKETYFEIYDALYSISENMKKEYLNIFNDLSSIPDDCFEIRQIKRQQTDF